MCITLYTTDYPKHEGRKWIWFNKKFWYAYPPRVGHLPEEVFNKLVGGKLAICAGCPYRQYTSDEEAVADLMQTGHVVATTEPIRVKRREWLEPLNLRFIDA